MFILSRVCADFRNKKGEVIHRVTPADRLGFHEAPDAIQEDPLFSMLVSEGSLEASRPAAGAPCRRNRQPAPLSAKNKTIDEKPKKGYYE